MDFSSRSESDETDHHSQVLSRETLAAHDAHVDAGPTTPLDSELKGLGIMGSSSSESDDSDYQSQVLSWETLAAHNANIGADPTTPPDSDVSSYYASSYHGSSEGSGEDSEEDVRDAKDLPLIKHAYWPVVRNALQTEPRAWERLHLSCNFCFRDLDMILDGANDNGQSGPACNPRVMICGHIFCEACLKLVVGTVEARRQSSKKPEKMCCPICSHCWDHVSCPHTNIGRRFPRPGRIHLDWIPPIHAEGGMISAQCTECAIRTTLHYLIAASPLYFDHGSLKPGQKLAIMANTGEIWFKLVHGPHPLEGHRYVSSERAKISYLNGHAETIIAGLNRNIFLHWGSHFRQKVEFEFWIVTEKMDSHWYPEEQKCPSLDGNPIWVTVPSFPTNSNEGA